MRGKLGVHRVEAALCAVLLGMSSGEAGALQARFDLNGDGRVDAADAQIFAACVSGPGVAHDGSLNCRAADIDGDSDVDQQDFGLFQRCFSGTHPADVNCANLSPPVCTIFSALQTIEDTPLMVQLTATDPDLPWDVLTFVINIPPTRGSRFYQVAPDGTPQTNLPPIGIGEFVTNPDARVWFVPPLNYYTFDGFPPVAFRYSVRDAAGAQSAPLDVPIYVASANDPPVVVTESYTGVNDRAMNPFFVHPHDVDLPPQAIDICFTQLPQYGTLYADGVTPITQVPSCFATHSYAYVWSGYRPFDCGPDLPASAFPIEDSFSYHANDGQADSATVTDPIEISYFNSPPVLTGPASVEVVEDTPVPVEITATDVDNDTVVVGFVDPLPTRGTLYYYDPDAFLTLPVTSGQEFAGAPVALTYVPLPNANTADGVPDLINVRLRDVRNQNPLDTRPCDYQIPIHIAAVNDPPVVTCYNTPVIIANVTAEGQISPAVTKLIQVADDALPNDLLAVTVTASGPEADHLVLADQTGLVGFQQVSPTQIQFQGTLVAMNAAFAQGVYWYPNGSQTYTGELTVEVNDQGHTGNENPPVPLTGTLVLPVSVEYEGTIPLTP